MNIDVKVEAEFLAAVLQKSPVVERDVLAATEVEYFQVESYRWLVELLKKRSWKPPAWEFLDQELLSIADEDTRNKHRAQLYALYVRQLTFEEDARDKFRAYVSFCTLNTKVRGAFEGFSRTDRIDLLIDEVKNGAEAANNVVQGQKLPVLDYADMYRERQEKRRIIRDNPGTNPRFLTGISGLDQQFIIRAPMLVDFLAPFKRYKSIFLNAIGYALLLQGHDVLHVTYENSLELTQDRYDSMFSELNFERVSNMLLTQEEKDRLDATFEWMRGWKNRLKIIKAEAFESKVADVEREIDRLREYEGFQAAVEVWDYLNIIAPSRPEREERQQQKVVVWDLKRHAEKYNVAVFEASQTNREGALADRVDLGHRGLATEIDKALDICIAINQTQQELDENLIILSPKYVREGAITVPEIVLDADISRMVVSRELHNLWAVAVRVNPWVAQKS